MRPRFQWQLRNRSLQLGERTLVMGIVNVTPDSFSDGGKFFSLDKAVGHALELLEEGADVLDIGGESTRPGQRQPVSEMEEQARILPVIDAVLREKSGAIVSVDTYHAATARRAVEAGAEIVNDVSAFGWDEQMAGIVARLNCGCVLMHMRAKPQEWHRLPRLSGDELLNLVFRELHEAADKARSAGVKKERIVLDPGFGFGKNFEENFPLLARLDELAKLGFPLLAGTSRKSFIGRALAKAGKDAGVSARLYGTMATVVASVLKGTHIVRVHDVQPVLDAVRLADEVLKAEAG